MSEMRFPYGPKLAFISSDWSLSFDDLHQLRYLIRAELLTQLKARPLRVLGCLRDDETSLLALLFITELFDYMPINPNLSDVEIARIVDESGVDSAVLSRDFLNDKKHLFTVPAVVNWDDVVAAALQSLALGKDGNNKIPAQENGRLILHTSGSTGLPKRVPISIGSINASARNIAAGHQLTSSDHALNALPTFHIGALVDVMLAPLSVGGAVSITDKRSPASLAEELITKRPTWIQIVPTILRRMVEDLAPDVVRDAGS
jgi:acyl-CoA synthetase (AMP-forming)/AMP-acid ligase II